MSISTKSMIERAGMFIYPWYISDLTASIDFEKEFGIGVTEIFMINKAGFLQAYYDVESADNVGKFLLDKIILDKNFYTLVIDNIYKKSSELEIFCESVANIKNINSLSDEKLVDIYDEYVIRLRSLRLWGWVPVFIDGINVSFLSDKILENLRDFLSKKGLEDKVSEYYSILSSSEKQSEVSREKIERLKLLNEISKLANGSEILKSITNKSIAELKNVYPEIYKKLEMHRNSFEWLTYSYSGPIMSMEHLVNVLKDDLTSNQAISEQYQLMIDYSLDLQKTKKKLATELQLNEYLSYLFEVSAEMMYMKDWRKGAYQKSYVIMDKVLNELAGRIDIDIIQIKYLVVDEIKRALLFNEADRFKILAIDRAKLCCYHIKNQKMIIYNGDDCQNKIKEVLVAEEKKEITDYKNDGLIKGMVAYGGKVTGIAKIVLSISDMEKINQGDILVSSSTNPDLIVAMGKAAAFVTDMGGITSHAAIVSREMKKPCVVGTKNATSLIKDGDLVEVDASNGLVKIIRK